VSRAALILLLVLTACASAREVVGTYVRAAEKGIEVEIGDAPAPAETQPGLTGDTANRAYTTDQPKP
jgi:hypothetical protein